MWGAGRLGLPVPGGAGALGTQLQPPFPPPRAAAGAPGPAPPALPCLDSWQEETKGELGQTCREGGA